MDYQATITGDKLLDSVFLNLPRSTQTRAYGPVLRAGAEPVKQAAHENLKAVSEPFTGLATRKNTLRVYRLRKFRGSFRVAVQVRRGLTNAAKRDKEGNPVRVGMYLAVLEYGSQKLNRRPRPWIRKAIKENVQPALDEMRKAFAQKLPDIISDARKKGRI